MKRQVTWEQIFENWMIKKWYSRYKTYSQNSIRKQKPNSLTLKMDKRLEHFTQEQIQKANQQFLLVELQRGLGHIKRSNFLSTVIYLSTSSLQPTCKWTKQPLVIWVQLQAYLPDKGSHFLMEWQRKRNQERALWSKAGGPFAGMALNDSSIDHALPPEPWSVDSSLGGDRFASRLWVGPQTALGPFFLQQVGEEVELES